MVACGSIRRWVGPVSIRRGQASRAHGLAGDTRDGGPHGRGPAQWTTGLPARSCERQTSCRQDEKVRAVRLGDSLNRASRLALRARTHGPIWPYGHYLLASLVDSRTLCLLQAKNRVVIEILRDNVEPKESDRT